MDGAGLFNSLSVAPQILCGVNSYHTRSICSHTEQNTTYTVCSMLYMFVLLYCCVAAHDYLIGEHFRLGRVIAHSSKAQHTLNLGVIYSEIRSFDCGRTIFDLLTISSYF